MQPNIEYTSSSVITFGETERRTKKRAQKKINYFMEKLIFSVTAIYAYLQSSGSECPQLIRKMSPKIYEENFILALFPFIYVIIYCYIINARWNSVNLCERRNV